MNNFTLKMAAAALLLSGSISSYAAAPNNFDISKFAYKGKKHSSVFNSPRMLQVEKANKVLEAGKPARFVNSLTETSDNQGFTPSEVFSNSPLHAIWMLPTTKSGFSRENLDTRR